MWWIDTKNTEQQTEPKAKRNIWLPHPKPCFPTIAWPGWTVKLKFHFLIFTNHVCLHTNQYVRGCQNYHGGYRTNTSTTESVCHQTAHRHTQRWHSTGSSCHPEVWLSPISSVPSCLTMGYSQSTFSSQLNNHLLQHKTWERIFGAENIQGLPFICYTAGIKIIHV